MQQQDLKAIGGRIKTIRKLHIGGQSSLAEESGLHIKTISHVENGHAKAPQEILDVLSDKYGYNIDWILTGKGSERRIKGKRDTSLNVHAKVLKLETELKEVKKVMNQILEKLNK